MIYVKDSNFWPLEMVFYYNPSILALMNSRDKIINLKNIFKKKIEMVYIVTIFSFRSEKNHRLILDLI